MIVFVHVCLLQKQVKNLQDSKDFLLPVALRIRAKLSIQFIPGPPPTSSFPWSSAFYCNPPSFISSNVPINQRLFICFHVVLTKQNAFLCLMWISPTSDIISRRPSLLPNEKKKTLHQKQLPIFHSSHQNCRFALLELYFDSNLPTLLDLKFYEGKGLHLFCFSMIYPQSFIQ